MNKYTIFSLTCSSIFLSKSDVSISCNFPLEPNCTEGNWQDWSRCSAELKLEKEGYADCGEGYQQRIKITCDEIMTEVVACELPDKEKCNCKDFIRTFLIIYF